jgi:aspartate 1-decarboxylase
VKTFLTVKLHGMTVTGCHLDYHGSQTIPESVLIESGIQPYEKILVVNQNNGKRWETYAIIGNEGVCTLNGAAAHNGTVGDKIIIMAFELAEKYNPATVFFFDENNRITDHLIYEKNSLHEKK